MRLAMHSRMVGDYEVLYLVATDDDYLDITIQDISIAGENIDLTSDEEQRIVSFLYKTENNTEDV